MKKYLSSITTSLVICLMISLVSVSKTLASEVKVREFIQQVSDKALALIIDKKIDDTARYSKLSDLFIDSVDTDWMARFVIASHWRDFNDAQKKQYLSIYKDFLVSSYVPKLKFYNNQKMVIE